MQDEGEHRETAAPNPEDDRSRPQQGGEGGTTRFGMEDGDNSDVPATGDGTREDGARGG
ncbi:hypothetical protein [Sphingosinicella sp. BN140058]|uniref:hypothetical protein n=1 Tax=Sphingosinicella sp. BN140058 TaxID=1892855 RepID=UPI0013EB0EEB|nr:hypothetical protein [Sphingosinicella sp. BN140058]